MADDEILSAEDIAGLVDNINEDGLESVDTSEGFFLPKDIQFFQTSTTAYKTGRNPRTIRAAYDYESESMYVVFWDTTYWAYKKVQPNVWQAFKAAESKGKFLWDEGFDSRGPQGMLYENGEVDFSKELPRRVAALRGNLERARKQQELLAGKHTTKRLMGKQVKYWSRGNRNNNS